MTVRPLDFLDLPFLARYRRHALTLDSLRLLTRGHPLGAAALLAYLDPRRFIYTAIARQDETALVGQVILDEGGASARLTCLAPANRFDGPIQPLLDHLSRKAAEWGALHLLAEVDEESPAFKSLRQAGFSMYAWQRVWRLPEAEDRPEAAPWRAAEERDWAAVQALYAQIIPVLLQPMEALPRQAAGLVCFTESGLQAFALVHSGAAGIFVQPLIPPDSACFPEQIAGLAQAVHSRERPVYLAVRSYQAWLEAPLAEAGAQAGPRQAVMVKRLARVVKEPQAVSAMEKVLGKAKPAAPVSRVEPQASETSKTLEV
ncbi:MAG: hypothetical protein ABWK53_09015 [Anaerolineales bacterium]